MSRVIKLASMVALLLFTSYVSATTIRKISAVDFVAEAYIKGLAEVEFGKLAVQKSTLPEVNAFAQQMATDHAAINKDLAALAKRKHLAIPDEAELLNKAKTFILQQREAEAFDIAYLNNQVDAHKAMVELYSSVASGGDADIRAFATATLPKLEEYLQRALQLQHAVAPTVKEN